MEEARIVSQSVAKRYLFAASHNRKVQVGGGIVLALLVVAFMAPLVAPYNPYEINAKNRLARPTVEHLLGTDQLGRDTLSQLIYGARTSLLVSCASTLLAYIIGIVLGVTAAYVGGTIESLIMVFLDVIRCFPTIIFIVAVVAVVGPSLLVIILVCGVTFSSLLGRTTRALAISICQEPFLEAGKSLGLKTSTILSRYIFKNVVAPTMVIAGMDIPLVMMAEAGLAFLGVGVPVPMISWGTMLRYGFENITRAWWLVLGPSASIGIAMLGFNLFLEGLREIFDLVSGGVTRASECSE